MREYKLTDAFDVINKSFAFLSEEWEFENTRADDLNYGCYFEYRKNKLTIYLGYDYKDNFFYFEFITNEQHLPISFYFKEKEPNLEWKLFEPDDTQYKKSLIHNIEYLKKYKSDILSLCMDGSEN